MTYKIRSLKQKNLNSFKNSFLLVNELIDKKRRLLNQLRNLQIEYLQLVEFEDIAIAAKITRLESTIKILVQLKKRIYSFSFISDSKNSICISNERVDFLSDRVYINLSLGEQEKFRARAMNENEYSKYLFPVLSGFLQTFQTQFDEVPNHRCLLTNSSNLEKKVDSLNCKIEKSKSIPLDCTCYMCGGDLRKKKNEGGCICCTQHQGEGKCHVRFRWTPEKFDEMRLDYSYYTAIRTKLDNET